MLQRSLSQSREQIGRHIQDEIQASRRNMSANRRDDVVINAQPTFEQPSPRYENFSPAQPSAHDQGKFFTKKTVANKSNVKISSQAIGYSNISNLVSPVVISNNSKPYVPSLNNQNQVFGKVHT